MISAHKIVEDHLNNQPQEISIKEEYFYVLIQKIRIRAHLKQGVLYYWKCLLNAELNCNSHILLLSD